VSTAIKVQDRDHTCRIANINLSQENGRVSASVIGNIYENPEPIAGK
jgi:hypothetical protein